MSDLIEKTILAGLGALSLSREKAEKLAKDLVKRGELSRNEEAKFVKDLMGQAKKGKVEMERRIEKTVKKILVKLDVPTRKELNALKARVDKLSKK